MSAPSFSKSGTKAATAVRLDQKIFGLEVDNHELLKQAYVSYLANGRVNLAKTLKRGQVRGGGRKPWRQKGTGRARFGSIRVPIWRGGGITFGPTGDENYTKKLGLSAKRSALRQALSLKAKDNQIKIIETFVAKDGKVKPTLNLLTKIGTKGRVLLVVSLKDNLVERATRNLPNVKAVQAKYLNVYDVLNADTLLISQKSLKIITDWLDKPARPAGVSANGITDKPSQPAAKAKAGPKS